MPTRIEISSQVRSKLKFCGIDLVNTSMLKDTFERPGKFVRRVKIVKTKAKEIKMLSERFFIFGIFVFLIGRGAFAGSNNAYLEVNYDLQTNQAVLIQHFKPPTLPLEIAKMTCDDAQVCDSKGICNASGKVCWEWKENGYLAIHFISNTAAELKRHFKAPKLPKKITDLSCKYEASLIECLQPR